MYMTCSLERGACFPTVTRSHYTLKNIYAESVLGMHPNYTNTPSSFYGASGGCSHTCSGPRRDPQAHPDPYPLVGLPIRIVIRIDDVAESSQLVIEERTALAEAAQKTLHGTMMVLKKERQRTLTSPTNPQL